MVEMGDGADSLPKSEGHTESLGEGVAGKEVEGPGIDVAPLEESTAALTTG